MLQTFPLHNPYSFQIPTFSTLKQAVIECMDDQRERLKLSSCRLRSNCNSIFCADCQHRSAYRKKMRVFKAVEQMPCNRLKFATFLARDVSLECLRETANTLMSAGRKALKRVRVSDYALRFEASTESWSDLYHGHLHAIVSTPSSGSGYVRESSWNEAWLEEIPAWLHPQEIAAHVELIRNPAAASTYLTKSPYAHSSQSVLQQTVEGIRATHGVAQFNVRGTFATLSRVN